MAAETTEYACLECGKPTNERSDEELSLCCNSGLVDAICPRCKQVWHPESTYTVPDHPCSACGMPFPAPTEENTDGR